MRENYQKLFNIRKSLDIWEKELGIDKLSTKSKIIIEYLLSLKKLPVPINEIRKDNFIEKNMSVASFNRCINELLKVKKIRLSSNPTDRRSQDIELI
tara:strand:- start:137 stop:427 length:291 start_codon:yes stop_codon:yes gene_type:complete